MSDFLMAIGGVAAIVIIVTGAFAFLAWWIVRLERRDR